MADLRQAATAALEEMKRLARLANVDHKDNPAIVNLSAALAEQPAQKRPQNCGTGFCSCIECVMEPEQHEPEWLTGCPACGMDGGCDCECGTWNPTRAEQQEPVAYDKTTLNAFAQDLYDKKMHEGKHGHYESMFHVIHQCIAMANTAPQPAIPPGYKLVPVEPTPEMKDVQTWDYGMFRPASEIWADMIAAAPEAPQPKAEQQEPPIHAELLCVCGAKWQWMNRTWELVATAHQPRREVELTANAILNLMPDSIPAEHDGSLIDFARAVIAAYRAKQGETK